MIIFVNKMDNNYSPLIYKKFVPFTVEHRAAGHLLFDRTFNPRLNISPLFRLIRMKKEFEKQLIDEGKAEIL